MKKKPHINRTPEENLRLSHEQTLRYATEISYLYRERKEESKELQEKLAALALSQRQSLLYAEELRTTYVKEREKADRLRKALREIEDTYDGTLLALVNALDAREHETNAHSHRVMEYTLEMARAAGVDDSELVTIGRGSLLHDIGKIGVTDNILLKPGKLTDEEWVEMKKHPYTGFKMLEGIKFLGGATRIVLSHQEKFDGTGYPQGLKGEAIPVGSRLFALADTLDAITSDRPYRKARGFEVAKSEFIRCRDTQFDPWAVEVFFSIPEQRWGEIREHTLKAATSPA
ncbi:MAG: HD domain-containing phosphohydrolase [Thermodesulfobacteriota bacterium]